MSLKESPGPLRGVACVPIATLLSILCFAAVLAQSYQLYLSGKVVLQDGSVPPSPARIELVCDGQIQPQAATKADGSFNFAVGGNQAQEIHAVSPDASQPSPGPKAAASRGFFDMSACEIRASLAGYRSSAVKLGRRSAFESPDVGTLVLFPLAGDEGGVVSASSLAVPEKALKAYQKGQSELTKEHSDPEKASKELQKAVKEFPEFAAAWNLLGEARIRMEDLEGAREALEKAIETDPKFAAPCVTLALLELKQGRVAEAAAVSEQAIQLVPDLAEARFYHGMANANLGNLEKAEESLRVVLTSPDAVKFPRTYFLLGNILAQKGQLNEAVSHFRRYLELEPDSRVAEAVRQQLEQWKADGLIQ